MSLAPIYNIILYWTLKHQNSQTSSGLFHQIKDCMQLYQFTIQLCACQLSFLFVALFALSIKVLTGNSLMWSMRNKQIFLSLSFTPPRHCCKCMSVFSPRSPLCCCPQDRMPFVVPERVPWRMMYSTLNSKFISEVQTKHNLDQYNQHFLAQKIFDKPDFADDFSNMLVSWAQFNKVHTSISSLAQIYTG